MKKRKPLLIGLSVLVIIGVYFALNWRQFYWTRIIAWGYESVEDYQIFPSRPMEAAEVQWDFPHAAAEESAVFAQAIDNIPTTLAIEAHQSSNFSTFLTDTETTTFLVIKEGELI